VRPGNNHDITFRLLGSVDVIAGGRVVEFGSRKQRVLLASLLIGLNRPVPVDALVEDLWGDVPPVSVQATLPGLVSRLRRAIESTSPANGRDQPRLRSRDGGYVLEASPEQVDAVRFDRLAADARHALAQGDAARAVDELQAALALWRGAALGDLADRPFARQEAQRLEEARRVALEDLADALLALGRAQDAVDRLTTHVAEHPLRERPWGQLMLALYRLGRQADALQAYQRLHHILREELAVDPGPSLRLLHEQILRQSADLAPVSQPTVSQPATEASRRSADIAAFLFITLDPTAQRPQHADRQALVLDIVESHGGELVGHTHHDFRFALPTAPAAVATAVEIQRALHGTAQSSPDPLRVRMAVHAGAARRRAKNWFGPILERTDDLLAAAADGQIVCSHVAAELGRDDLPAGVGLIDLGEHQLAELARPERVYQLTHPDLPTDFPPLRSFDARRHNLPVALNSFVGRERELHEIDSELATARLLTLTGTGGVGKTRLALEVAASARDRFPDGVWFIELAPVRDPELVTDEVVTSLGLLPSALVQPGQTLEEGLCAHLRTRRLLLVLDNCEHLVEAAARLGHTLLGRCPDITVLATSREVLDVPGEVVWNVPPLSVPTEQATSMADLARCDAVALFCERARSAQPGFALSDANGAAVARICRRLDGIPLGLELAAGKIRMLGAHQVAERLDDRFRLLTGGSRAAVGRHQTLRATMDWSYTLLPAAEQIVLRRLSVFSGTFSLAAAEAVTGAVRSTSGRAVETLDALSRLVAKSLVTVHHEDPEVRYGLLETVREYGGDKLSEAGEAVEVRARHRDYFLGLADAWAMRTDYWHWWQWIPQVSTEVDNFAAALRWSLNQGDYHALLRLAAAHWPYWYWGEALTWQQWLPDAIKRCDTPSPARAEALSALALLLTRSGANPTHCDGLFQQAMDTAAGLASEEAIARVNFYRAHLLLSRGERQPAEDLIRDSLGRSSNADFLGWCHWELGWIALFDDHLDDTATEFDAALRLAEHVHDESLCAHLRPAMALLAALRGDYQTARLTAAEGIRAAERIVGAPRVLMLALALAGQVAVLTAVPSARPPVSRLLRLLRDKGVTYWADEALAVAALVLADRRPEQAAILLTSEPLRSVFDDTPRNQLTAMRERLHRCRTELIETLGSPRWQETEHRTPPMPTEQAITHALAALDTLAAQQ
jgi:predicted ATPase/DNA-binding SARP family transcriptional activator